MFNTNKKSTRRLLKEGNFIISIIVLSAVGLTALYTEFNSDKETYIEQKTAFTNREVKYNEQRVSVKLQYVVDGDTIAVGFFGKNERVRVIGVDTPERDEDLYKEATDFTKEFLKSKPVEIEICSLERRDDYGRLLAWVYAGGVSLEEELLKSGLAKTLAIPPCGRRFKSEYKKLKNSAKEKGLGLWRR